MDKNAKFPVTLQWTKIQKTKTTKIPRIYLNEFLCSALSAILEVFDFHSVVFIDSVYSAHFAIIDALIHKNGDILLILSVVICVHCECCAFALAL